MILRHRTVEKAPGDGTSGWWEFLPEGGFPFRSARVLISVGLGDYAIVECEVPVCTNRTAKEKIPGRWVLVPRKGDWLLTSARMPEDMQQTSLLTAFHEDLPAGPLSLVGAPAEVHLELVGL